MSDKLKVAFLWHYSQPYVKDLNGNYLLPVVRQYLQRDYVDMVKISRKYKKLRLTFNVVPGLLEQLNDYATGTASDYSWILSKKPADKLTEMDKEFILTHFFKGVDEVIILPYPRYRELYEKRARILKKGYIGNITPLFSVDEYRDLQVWHNLAWVGSESKKDNVIHQLLLKGENFTERDKAKLSSYLDLLHKTIFAVYEDQINHNRIEVSTSPFYNTILPIAMDSHSVRLKNPDLSLPINRFKGKRYVKEQLLNARKTAKQHFRQASFGLVPHQMAVDTKSLDLIAKLRFDWTILDSDQLPNGNQELVERFFPVNFTTNDAHDITCFIRDTYLNEKTFRYTLSELPVDQAVDLFFETLTTYKHEIITSGKDLNEAIVTIPLSGDLLWDYFPNSGSDFLNALYERFDSSTEFRTITFHKYLKEVGESNKKINALNPQSDFCHFDRWIGNAAANRAWDHIANTAQFISQMDSQGEVSEKSIEEARNNFHIALGSEWFQWYSHKETRWDIFYDELFRSRLIRCYELLHEKPPKTLFYNLKNESSFIFNSLPVTSYIHPDIDGYDNHFEEWQGAALYDAHKQRLELGNHTENYIRHVSIGYNETSIFFGIVFENYPPYSAYILIDFLVPNNFSLHIEPLIHSAKLYFHTDQTFKVVNPNIHFAFNDMLELELNVKDIGLEPNRIFATQVCLIHKDSCFERFPQTSVIRTLFRDPKIEMAT